MYLILHLQVEGGDIDKYILTQTLPETHKG